MALVQNKKLFIVVSVLIAVLAGILLYAMMINNRSLESKQTNSEFEACLAAGNELIKTNPAKCETNDGKVYTENNSQH